MQQADRFRIVSEPIDASWVVAAVEGHDCGAITVFLGTVREVNEGRRVLSLEYHAYEEMALREIEAIGAEIHERFGPCRAAIVHRLGHLSLGDVSVTIAVAAPHRARAFEACRYGIERLKERVPIWKKEHFEGGEVWIEGCRHEGDD